MPGDIPIDVDNINFAVLNYTQLSDAWLVAKPEVIATKATALVLLALVAIVANGSIIYVVSRTRALHTPINIFILNVAIADLLNASFSSWTFLIVDTHQNYILGEVFCTIDGAVEITCMVASVLSLVAISCDRFVGIMYPFVARMTNKIAGIVIGIIWIIAIGVAIPQAHGRTYKERQWADFLEQYCTEKKQMMKTYWMWMLGLIVWGPLVILLFAYVIIICKIQRHKAIQQSHNDLRRRKVIIMLFTIVIVFFLCWLPFQVLVLYRNFNKVSGEQVNDWYKATFFVAHYLALSNTAINPFIYGAANDNFKHAFKLQFPCLFSKHRRIRPSMIRYIFSTSLKQVSPENGNVHSEAPTMASDLDETAEDVNANELPAENKTVEEFGDNTPINLDDVNCSSHSSEASFRY